VDQRLGAAVQVSLEILLRNRVAAERAQGEHVLAHEPQELARAAQVIPLRYQNRIASGHDAPRQVWWADAQRRKSLTPAARPVILLLARLPGPVEARHRLLDDPQVPVHRVLAVQAHGLLLEDL